jgi:hypothetical protein
MEIVVRSDQSGKHHLIHVAGRGPGVVSHRPATKVMVENLSLTGSSLESHVRCSPVLSDETFSKSSSIKMGITPVKGHGFLYRLVYSPDVPEIHDCHITARDLGEAD